MKLTKLQKAIKKYCYNTPGMEVTKNYFLLDFTVNPVGCTVIRNLIEKHFHTYNHQAYLGINEIWYKVG